MEIKSQQEAAGPLNQATQATIDSVMAGLVEAKAAVEAAESIVTAGEPIPAN